MKQSESITLLRQELLGLIEYFHEGRFILRKEHENQSQRIYIGDGKEAVEKYLSLQPSKKFLVWLQDTHSTIETSFAVNCGVEVRVEEHKFHTPTITLMEEAPMSKIDLVAWGFYPDGFTPVYSDSILEEHRAKHRNECRQMLDNRRGYTPQPIRGYRYEEFIDETAHPQYCRAILLDSDNVVIRDLGRVLPTVQQADYLSSVLCELEIEATYRELNKMTAQ